MSLARGTEEKNDLEEQAKQYEDVIRSAMWKSSPDILLNHEIKWENVRDSLGNDDIAIEFLSLPTACSTSHSQCDHTMSILT